MSFTELGMQRCETTRTRNRRLAQKILDSRLGAIAEGRQPLLVKTNALRLKAWAEQFLQTVPGKMTHRRYSCSVANLLRHFGEQTRLTEIGTSQIEAFKRARLKEEVGPATINRDLAVLRRMLKLAARERLIARSPFADDGVESLEERKGRQSPRIISFEEEQKILGASPPLLRALVILLIETGLRTGEALRLKWGDVDLASETIQVHESKTVAGRRLVCMSRLCKAELLNWKKLVGPNVSPFVFPNMDNPAAHLQSVRKPWATALKKAKLEFFRLYDLRANFASRLSASGAPDNLVAGVIGHSCTSIVQTYAKVVDEYRKDAITKLEAYRQKQQGRVTASAETPSGPPN